MSRRGFVQPEYMIFIATVGVGAALVIPGILRMIRHQPVGTGNWVGLAAGVILFLLVPVLMVRWGFVSLGRGK